jgi:hypothetical protein
MALLYAQVDTDMIRMLGWWRSDEMLRYLHLSAKPFMRNNAERMLTGGSFVLHPNQDILTDFPPKSRGGCPNSLI